MQVGRADAKTPITSLSKLTTLVVQFIMMRLNFLPREAFIEQGVQLGHEGFTILFVDFNYHEKILLPANGPVF